VDWGILTAVVAAIFAAVGLVVGFFAAKLFFGREEKEDFSALEEDIRITVNRISEALGRLNAELDNLREERLSAVRRELESLEKEVSHLKGDVANLPLSPDSFEALGRAEVLLKEVDLSLPSVDNSLLTQIKDSLIILRNDVQALTLQIQQEREREKEERRRREEERKTAVSNLEDLLLSVNTALDLSRELNRALVGGDLIGIAASLKGDLGEDLAKILDSQTLNSKELVLILERLKKELEGVGK